MNVDDFVSPSRLVLMKSGVTVWQTWMANMYTKPILEYVQTFHQERDSIAASLVDAKLGKIGQRIRLLSPSGNQVEADAFLYQWTYLQLLLKFWQEYEELEEGLKLNLLYQSGVQFSKKNLSTAPRIEEDFFVVYQSESKIEKLRQRDVWLLGRQSKQWHLLRDFAFGKQNYDQSYKEGQLYGGKLVALPFAGSFRRWKDQLYAKHVLEAQSFAMPWVELSRTLTQLAEDMKALLMLNPFMESMPTVLSLQSICVDGEWIMMDKDEEVLASLLASNTQKSMIYSACFYAHTTIVGLWTRHGFRPWGLIASGEYILLPEEEGEK